MVIYKTPATQLSIDGDVAFSDRNFPRFAAALYVLTFQPGKAAGEEPMPDPMRRTEALEEQL